MMYLLLRWLILAIAIGLTAWFLPGMTLSGGVAGLLIVAVVLGLLNAILRPIIMFLTCPMVILTLGLFTLVINALILWLTSWLLPNLLQVNGFWTVFWAALIISIISALLGLFLHDESNW